MRHEFGSQLNPVIKQEFLSISWNFGLNVLFVLQTFRHQKSTMLAITNFNVIGSIEIVSNDGKTVNTVNQHFLNYKSL